MITPYLLLVLAGFAVFIAVLGIYSLRTLVEAARQRRKPSEAAQRESS